MLVSSNHVLIYALLSHTRYMLSFRNIYVCSRSFKHKLVFHSINELYINQVSHGVS